MKRSKSKSRSILKCYRACRKALLAKRAKRKDWRGLTFSRIVEGALMITTCTTTVGMKLRIGSPANQSLLIAFRKSAASKAAKQLQAATLKTGRSSTNKVEATLIRAMLVIAHRWRLAISRLWCNMKWARFCSTRKCKISTCRGTRSIAISLSSGTSREAMSIMRSDRRITDRSVRAGIRERKLLLRWT